MTNGVPLPEASSLLVDCRGTYASRAEVSLLRASGGGNTERDALQERGVRVDRKVAPTVEGLLNGTRFRKGAFLWT